MIEFRELKVGYGNNTVISSLSGCFASGEVTMLVGPNGSGKSTLFKTLAGVHPKLGGEILIDGISTDSVAPRQLAQKLAYMPQSRNVPNITAGKLALHGRFPYLSYPRRYSREDYEIARRALAWADAEDLASVPLPELSGGQRQKVYLAMVLAQETPIILMDEPTSFLDVRHQLELIRLVRRMSDEGKTVILVMHDLRMAMQAADKIAIMDKGELLSLDTPKKTYESGLIDRVFHIHMHTAETPEGRQYFYTDEKRPKETGL